MARTTNTPPAEIEHLLTQAEVAREINRPAIAVLRGIRRGLFRPDFIAGNFQLFRAKSVAVIDAALNQTSQRAIGIQAGDDGSLTP